MSIVCVCSCLATLPVGPVPTAEEGLEGLGGLGTGAGVAVKSAF